jgi:hypothetical protein
MGQGRGVGVEVERCKTSHSIVKRSTAPGKSDDLFPSDPEI